MMVVIVSMAVLIFVMTSVISFGNFITMAKQSYILI